MIITNTFISDDLEARCARLAAIHRRCILLLQAVKERADDA